MSLIGRRTALSLRRQRRHSRISISTSSILDSIKQDKPQTSLLDDKVDIAIIGGGITGTSLAYHLAKQSNKKVSLSAIYFVNRFVQLGNGIMDKYREDILCPAHFFLAPRIYRPSYGHAFIKLKFLSAIGGSSGKV
jgi:heterodisulfide reductase subunit A-like polyferredoxin